MKRTFSIPSLLVTAVLVSACAPIIVGSAASTAAVSAALSGTLPEISKITRVELLTAGTTSMDYRLRPPPDVRGNSTIKPRPAWVTSYERELLRELEEFVAENRWNWSQVITSAPAIDLGDRYYPNASTITIWREERILLTLTIFEKRASARYPGSTLSKELPVAEIEKIRLLIKRI